MRVPTLRVSVVLSLSVAAGILAFTAAAGLSGAWTVAAAVAVGAVGLTAWASCKRPVLAVDEAAAPRRLRLVSLLATAVALVQLGRLAVFMVDPAQVACSTPAA